MKRLNVPSIEHISVRVSRTEKQALSAAAKRRGTNISELIRELMSRATRLAA